MLRAKKTTVAAANRFASFAYKHEPRREREAPFGLQADTASLLGEILKKDSTLKESVTGLMSQAKASGTMESYERSTKKFEKFCIENQYSYPVYTEQAVLHFIIQLDKDKASMATLCQVKPALQLLEQLSGGEGTAWSDIVNIFLASAKRRAAIEKPPVQKAGSLPEDTMFRLYPVCFQHVEKSGLADSVRMRTFVRAVVIYFTFCRFNCYNKLRAQDFEDMGDSIKITFQSSKNDQYHNGQSSYVVENDSVINPVQIIRSYFKLCGFKFGLANGDQSFVNCVMRRKKAGWKADGRRSISYSTSTRDVRNVLAAAGIFVEKASDKSFKMLGVMMTLESGTALESVRDQGRWRTLSMPLHYKTNSDQFKKSVASQVPVRIIRATS